MSKTQGNVTGWNYSQKTDSCGGVWLRWSLEDTPPSHAVKDSLARANANLSTTIFVVLRDYSYAYEPIYEGYMDGWDEQASQIQA
jgi:hypothetical protein